MLTTLAGGVVAAAGAALVAVLAWVLSRSAAAGAALVVVLYLVEACLVSLPGFRFGVLIYPQDVAFVLLGVSAVIRMARGITALQGVLLAYVALVLWSFLRGIQAFGAPPAGVDARVFVYLVSGALYFSTFEFGPRVQRQVARLLMGAAAVLLGLAVFRWIATLLGLAIVEQWAPITTNPMRVLHSGHALFLSQCGLLIFAVHLDRAGKGRYLAGPVFAAVVLLQHRTVWAQVLVVIALGVLFSGRLRGRLVWRAVAISLLGGALALTLFGSQLESLSESMRASATGDDTWTWRVRGWQILMARFMASDVAQQLLGAPFGSGYVRQIGMSRVSVNPHSFYVQNILRVGFVGFTLFSVLYLLVMTHLSRVRAAQQGSWLRPGLVQLLIVSQLLYFITYPPGFEQCLFLGLALGYLKAAERTRRPAPQIAIKPRQKAWTVPPRLASRP